MADVVSGRVPPMTRVRLLGGARPLLMFATCVIVVNVGMPASQRVRECDRNGAQESEPDPLAPGELAQE